MSEGITVEVIGANQLLTRFKDMPQKMRAEIRTALGYIGDTLANYCRANKLSGQVLNRRTSQLYNSIRRGDVNENPSRMSVEITSRPGNAPVEYAAFWELGFKGQETVRAHMRRTAAGGEVNVREHIRNINQAARPFLRPTRDENVGWVQDQMQAAVVKATQ